MVSATQKLPGAIGESTNPPSPRVSRAGRQAPVTFDDAVRVQEVLDAAQRSAAGGGVWIDVPTDGNGSASGNV